MSYIVSLKEFDGPLDLLLSLISKNKIDIYDIPIAVILDQYLEYLEEMRVYKAEELLMFTDFDLTYIANECGYSDCSHLINSFKKHKNMTPKQFRKMQNDLS